MRSTSWVWTASSRSGPEQRWKPWSSCNPHSAESWGWTRRHRASKNSLRLQPSSSLSLPPPRHHCCESCSFFSWSSPRHRSWGRDWYGLMQCYILSWTLQLHVPFAKPNTFSLRRVDVTLSSRLGFLLILYSNSIGRACWRSGQKENLCQHFLLLVLVNLLASQETNIWARLLYTCTSWEKLTAYHPEKKKWKRTLNFECTSTFDLVRLETSELWRKQPSLFSYGVNWLNLL